MADVYDVADFFIEWANKSEEAMTNLWLNKLMYFAQGHFLARHGKPLFDAAIEAWTFGPVVPCVYQKYRVCGKNPIATTSPDYSDAKFTKEEQLFLVDILREYGIYSASKLVSMTHAPNTPWSETYAEGSKKEIPQEAMQKFFSQPPNILLPFDVKTAISAMEVIPTRRDEHGVLVIPHDEDEDDEWDDL